MSDQTITCPGCNTKIKLTDALTTQIKDHLKGEMQKEINRKEAEIKIKEEAMKEKERALAESQKNIDEQIDKKVQDEKAKLWKVAQEKAEEKISSEMQDLKKSNQEKEKQLDEMRKQEMDLRQQKRHLEDKERNLNLEMERKMDEERNKISIKAKEEATEELNKKISEKDKQMDQMRKTIEDLKRKSEQGSMQVQGDAQEADLKRILQDTFPIDVIEDVPTGIKGADLMQSVNSNLGTKCGLIIWESKNTKAWNNEWIKKLKDDQINAKADIAILVSQTLPEGIENFGRKDGVWVVSFNFALSLVSALRFHLTEISQVNSSLVGKGEKMEYLYNYLSGPEFKNRIENIVSAFSSMKEELDKERRAMERIWSRREKEIDRVVMNTSGLYGDLQGIIGASLPTIQALELPSGDKDENDEALHFENLS